MLITDRIQIGNNLFRIRKERNLTQFEAAELVGISDRAYADIERGYVNMRIDTLCKICVALHIMPNDLLVSESDDTEVNTNTILSGIENCSKNEKKTVYAIITAYLKAIHKL